MTKANFKNSTRRHIGPAADDRVNTTGATMTNLYNYNFILRHSRKWLEPAQRRPRHARRASQIVPKIVAHWLHFTTYCTWTEQEAARIHLLPE
jgi:adenylosuccinate synthase